MSAVRESNSENGIDSPLYLPTDSRTQIPSASRLPRSHGGRERWRADVLALVEDGLLALDRRDLNWQGCGCEPGRNRRESDSVSRASLPPGVRHGSWFGSVQRSPWDSRLPPEEDRRSNEVGQLRVIHAIRTASSTSIFLL